MPSKQRLCQIKVELNGTKPPVWRRLLVSSATDLLDLHTILQIAMGWTDSHLHQFIAGSTRYQEPDPEFDDDAKPEAGVHIDNLLQREKQWITYEYDFGDGWEHRLTLEKVLPGESGKVVPKCLNGGRGCPPEDVGGVYGYARFLDIYKDKRHPEHDEMVEWAGEYFDPEEFDIESVNSMLAEAYGSA
ncbi:MAG: plasmid pRiA4b ORF-3 family protein [Pseudohongiellaceae bacterium]